MTPSEKIIDRLRVLGFAVPEGTEVRRTYAGLHQRRDGAWSWFLEYPEPVPGLRDIGSVWPLRDLLRWRLMVTRSDVRTSLDVDKREPLPPIYQWHLVAQEPYPEEKP